MFCTQNQLITEHAPIYPYEAVIRLKLTVSIRLTAVNITAVNSQVWGLDGTGVLPVQPYRTNRNIRLRCAALMHSRISDGENKPIIMMQPHWRAYAVVWGG